jgi:beta-lactamase regulating signal transducer with metallopeptidase domain
MNFMPSLLLTSPFCLLLFKWTSLLLLGWCAHALLHRYQPRWRLILWRSLLCFALLLPVVQLAHLPGIKIRIIAPATAPVELDSMPPSIAPNHAASAAGPIAKPGTTSATVVHSLSHMLNPPARNTQWWFSGLEIWIMIWMTGYAGRLIQLTRLHLALVRLRHAAQPADSWIQQLAGEIQTRLQVRRRFDVRTSDAIASPFVCGLWQPTIMIPAALANGLDPEDLRALLNHEMAHIRQHDLIWCVAWQWIKAIFWFHPLVWFVPAVHSLACEEEADRLAAAQMSHRGNYTLLLARLALEVFALPPVETRLTVNGSSQIAKRLKWLGAGRHSAWNWRHSLVALTIVGLIFLGTAGCQFARVESTPRVSSDKTEFKRVLVVVVDENGKPVQGATISPEGFRVKGRHSPDAYGWRTNDFGPPEQVVTDAAGKAYVKYPVMGIREEKEPTGAIYFAVSHPDFSAGWQDDYSVDKPEQPIRLVHGIHLAVSGYYGPDHRPVPVLVPNLNEVVIQLQDWQTNTEHVYQFNKMSPGNHLLQLMGQLDNGQIVYSDTIEFTAESGKAYDFNLEMQPGIRLEGRLDDRVPRPVANGRVLIGVRSKEFPTWTNWNQIKDVFDKFPDYAGWRSYRTIAPDGTFVFESVPPGTLDVIVHGDGFASQNSGYYAHNFGVPQVFPLARPTTQIEVATERTATLEFCAKTSNGKPIAGASVFLNPNVIRINGIFGNMRHSSESPLRLMDSLPDVPYEATTDNNGFALIRNVPAWTTGMEVYDLEYQVPIQDPARWRDRNVRVHFDDAQTNKLVMILEPKGSDYLGTAN